MLGLQAEVLSNYCFDGCKRTLPISKRNDIRFVCKKIISVTIHIHIDENIQQARITTLL
jgi:hypothetical protein